jgi:hypothetical protein
MANTFKRKVSRNIGNVAITVGNLTVGASTTTIVLGLTICNTTAAAVSASCYLNDGSLNYYLVAGAPIPGGGSLVVVGGDQKLVLQTNDSIKVISDSASSLDVVMSIMEIT